MQESEVLSRIVELCAARNWSLYRLAKKSNITYSTLCTMLRNATAPSLTTLIKICNGFGINLSEFFDINNELAPLTPEQRLFLQQYNSLDENGRASAEKYIRYLIQQQNQGE